MTVVQKYHNFTRYGVGVNEVCHSETEGKCAEGQEAGDAAFTPYYMLKARALFKRNKEVELDFTL